MKTIYFTLTFMFYSFLSLAQPSVEWEPEITVSNGTIYGNMRPRMTIVNGDTPVILSGRGGTGNVNVSRWNGSSFDTPVTVIPTGLAAYVTGWTGPDIASKGDTVIAVYKITPLETGNVYAVRSTDGGVTFSDTIRVDNHDQGVAWMPSMDIDNDGNPVVTYMAHTPLWDNPEYVVVHSDDAGLTYNPEVNVVSSTPGEACDCCPAEMVIKDQTQVLLYRNNDANIRDIHAVTSLDGGATFPYEANVDSLNWFITSCPSTGPDGVIMGTKLITASASRASGDYRIYVTSSSIDGTLEFETRMMVSEPSPTTSMQNYPRISGENDTIVMAWQENVGNDPEIYYSVSLPGADHLTNLTTLKFVGNESSNGSQVNPDIVYKNGFVHLAYQDVLSGDLKYRRGTIQMNVGIEELEKSITVYPNPSNKAVFNLSNLREVNSIVNTLGQNIDFTQVETTDGTRIKLKSNAKGIYFLSYQTESNQQRVQKIIVN